MSAKKSGRKKRMPDCAYCKVSKACGSMYNVHKIKVGSLKCVMLYKFTGEE